MFSSLVVVFPTHHKGRALQLYHKGQEWTVNPAAIASMPKVPSIAYVTFYGDIKHEVSMVTSGYHVTLTYNFYVDDTTSNPSPSYHSRMKEDEFALCTSLTALLDHHNLLPDGRYLGFNLKFMYPVVQGTIRGLINSHKGSDAMIKLVLDKLSLQSQVKIIYEDKQDAYPDSHWPDNNQPPIKRPHIMLDDKEQIPNWEMEDPFWVVLPQSADSIVICDVDEVGQYSNGYHGSEII